VLDQEPSYLVDYSFNSYSNSNGPQLIGLCGDLLIRNLTFLLTVHPQYIWVIDYNSQLSRSTYDAVCWTRNHLVRLNIASFFRITPPWPNHYCFLILCHRPKLVWVVQVMQICFVIAVSITVPTSIQSIHDRSSSTIQYWFMFQNI
jgi:hypothetical protein